ncbi:MAG: hypothetical protein KDA37_10420, partial [Planctomycetales bacterium]|nr:hypothetical protein [Planctomycetales bacterium]
GEQLALGDAKGNHLAGGGPTEGVGPQRTYTLESQKMQLDLLLDSKRATPADLICEGRVRFAENPTGASREKPLSVAGERLKVSNLRSGSVEVQVSGASDPAQIIAQGLALKAATVMLSQRSNRLWADGAGSAQVNVNRDLFGQATAAATTLNLTWQGGLDFDGRTITVRENVLGEGPHDWVRCQQVTAALTRAVDFTRPQNGREVQVAKIDCTGGVTIDHRGVDAGGQQSHEHGSIQTIAIDQTTGELSGTGPGWIRSVRLTTSDQKRSLQFLRVHFLHGITGNVRNKQLSFLGNVRAVYGPVAGWQQELPLNPPGALPPDTGTLECERLTVNEDPLARTTPVMQEQNDLGPVELHAIGNVKIQGAAEGKGLFTAYAGAASYSKSKEEFVLEWDGRSLATIWQQDAPGSPPRKSEAQKLTYWRLIPRVKIENFSRATSGPASAQRETVGTPRR